MLQQIPLLTVHSTAAASILSGIETAVNMCPTQLSACILIPRSQVDTLKVGWCKIGEADGAKALADLLMFNQTLSTVDLRGNILVRSHAPSLLMMCSTGRDGGPACRLCEHLESRARCATRYRSCM